MSQSDHGWSTFGDVAVTDFAKGQDITVRFVGSKLADAQMAPIIDERLKCWCAEDDCRREATQEDGFCDQCRVAGCQRR